MKRPTTILLISSGVAALALAFGPASTAMATDVTNPAENPYPITVVVDGQTYHDGLDTLPGYDDYACTIIPGVSYDFAKNEIDYPDGQIAPWTEWSRIPGYAVWLKQQSSVGSGSGSSSGSSSGGSSSSGSTSGSGSSSGSSKKSGSSKSSAKSSSDAKTVPASAKRADSASDSKTTTDASSSATTTTATTTTASAPITVAKATTTHGALKTSTLTDAVGGLSGTSGAGIAILITLALAGILVLGVHRFGRVIFRRTPTGL